MRIKPGVDLKGMRPELCTGLIVADSAYRRHNLDLVVTAVRDGQHMTGSLHYVGLAADLRLPAPALHEGHQQSTLTVLADLKDALGRQWDVVLESDHIHMEFDPK